MYNNDWYTGFEDLASGGRSEEPVSGGGADIRAGRKANRIVTVRNVNWFNKGLMFKSSVVSV